MKGDVKYGTPVVLKENTYVTLIFTNSLPRFLFMKTLNDDEVLYQVRAPFHARTQLFDFTGQPNISVNWYETSPQQLRFLFFVFYSFIKDKEKHATRLLCYTSYFNYDLEKSDIILENYKAFWKELDTYIAKTLSPQLKKYGTIKFSLHSNSNFSLS